MESKYIINHTRVFPLFTKLNPIWWFGNHEEPVAPSWYHPDRTPNWWRQLSWYLRNPLQNFSRYVVGVNDRNYWIYGSHPVDATTVTDAYPDRYGWKWSVIHIGIFLLPFVSFENRYIKAYFGWQHWGFFGGKFNLKESPIELW